MTEHHKDKKTHFVSELQFSNFISVLSWPHDFGTPSRKLEHEAKEILNPKSDRRQDLGSGQDTLITTPITYFF